jgi:hypothetical protein
MAYWQIVLRVSRWLRRVQEQELAVLGNGQPHHVLESQRNREKINDRKQGTNYKEKKKKKKKKRILRHRYIKKGPRINHPLHVGETCFG